MGQRIAVVDLGTNTFHLLIGDKNDQLDIVFQETRAVKLGEGGINKNIITEAAFQRGLEAMLAFAHTIREHNVDLIRAAGTAALRSAANGQEFIERVRTETGIRVKAIDGQVEARLIYEGVKHGAKLDRDRVLVMDIGGGSVEFIIADGQQIFWQDSFPIGAARLMERFHEKDPISADEVQEVDRYLHGCLGKLREAVKQFKPGTLVGSAGAFETWAALTVKHLKLPQQSESTLFNFPMEQFWQVSDELLKSRHEERASNPDIPPVRVDMIIVATVLVNHVLRELDIRQMQLCRYALKEGILFADTIDWNE